MSVESLSESVSVSEAAMMYGCHYQTIIYHINRGNLTHRTTPSGRILIDVDSLNALHLKRFGVDLQNTIHMAVQKAI